jgi:hypothetical protein
VCWAGIAPFWSPAVVSGSVVCGCELVLLCGDAEGEECSSTISGSSSRRAVSWEGCCSGGVAPSGEPQSSGLLSAKSKQY